MKYILYALLLSTLFSCEEQINDPFVREPVQAVKTDNEPQIQLSINDAASHLDSIIENYTSADKHTFPHDSVLTKPALLQLRSEDLETLEHLLTLMMIKKYRFHVECCRQGYEMRNIEHMRSSGLDTTHHPMLYEFLRFSKSYDHIGYDIATLLKKDIEFMNSGIIMNWLEKEPRFLENPKIKEHYDFIKGIEERADYW